ncbi:MAG: ribosome silencing factor [Devosiaceae bacterium]|nr:ribosome silencing factor [Devosiaceae bacterium]
MTEAAPKDKSGSKAKKKSSQMINIVIDCLDDAKAEDIISIDMFGKSPMSDHMVITSGRSQRHVGALASQLSKALKEAGFKSPRIEGLPNCDWVLVDAGDVIIHIFRPEVREFYNLEKMWQGDLAGEQAE